MLKGAALAGAALLCKPSFASAFSTLQHPEVHTQTRVLLGTFVTLSTVHSSKTHAEEALGRTFEHISQLEAELTRHKSSPLTELQSKSKLLNAPKHLLTVLQKATHIHTLSGGAFDITVAPLLDAYASGTFDIKEIQAAKDLMQAKEIYISQDHVRLGRQGMKLTLDGIAKGYIADCASDMLYALGMDNHLVNAGGDIRARGQKAPQTPWRVGIENPAGNGKILTTIPLQGALATSGNYEKYFSKDKKYHHLIDPKRAQSSQFSASVSVMAPTSLEADALATALSAMPSSKALSLINTLPHRACMLVSPQGHVRTSHNWG